MKQTVSMKRVISFLMALVMVLGMLPHGGLHIHAHAAEAVTMTGGEVLYLKPNSNWHVDNARFAAYFFGDGNTWADLEPVPHNEGYYQVTVPEGYWTNVIFCRMTPSANDNNWDNKWNQTADLCYDGVNNLFTVPDGYWDGASTGWSTWSLSENHSYENGFCACGVYQSADYNEETGVYEIGNAGQLYWYAQELNENNAEIYVKLTADITVPENAPNWEPINSSYAYFDGNFKTISGLKCIGGDAQYVGLFGYEGWWYEISNLHITNSYFDGSGYVGAVVACMTNGGSVTNCCVTDTTVTGDGDYVGALAGYLSMGSVINCFVDKYPLTGGYSSGYVSIENSYHLSAEETEDGGKTAAQFASGEVAFLLQAGQQPGYDYDDEGNEIEVPAAEVWGQTIGVDEFPVLGGQKVYQGYGSCADRGYTNSPNPSPERPDHSGEIEYTPNADGTTHSGVYSCCGEVVTENEAHTQPLTWVNLGEAGHISYYPCCQTAEDVETVPHSYDESTLLCSCGQAHPDAVVLVSMDGTPVRAFTDVEFAASNAVTYTAEDKAVLKLLKSVDLGEGNVNLYSGVYTLDLNGFALTSSDSSSGAVCIYHDADLTICNGTIVGSNNCIQLIEGKVTVSDVTCLEANFGIMMYDGELILRRCDIQTGYGMLVNSGSVTVYDSTFATDQDVDIREDGIITFCEGTEFPGGLSVDGVSLESLLPEGMAYWTGNTMIVTQEGATEIWGNVTVKAACTHEDSTTVYIPKDVDNHVIAYSCCFSGPLEPHSLDEEGKCTFCGFDPANSVIIRMTDSYGDGWGGNAIRIYEDGVLIDTTTVLEGSEASWICAYNPEKEYEFCWVKGYYSTECSFELIVAGESVFTADRNDCNNYNDGYKFFPVCQHVYDEGVVTAPTCTSVGYTTYTCTLCGLSYKDNWQDSLGGHKKAEGDEGDVTAPTCVSVGYTSYTCTVCGESYEDNLVDPLAHVLGEDGNCTVCGNLYSIPVYVSGNHVTFYNMADVLGDGTVSYDPTTNTLTLNGYRGSDIYMETSLNILLLGENTIETDNYGIMCYFHAGTVNISGTGSLDIISAYESITTSGDSVTLTIGGSATLNLMGAEEGIYLSADTVELVIRDNATVIIGTEEAPMEEECIYVDGNITGSVTITDNASVTCVTADEEGIFVGGGHSYLTVSGNANVYVAGDEEGLDAEFITISGGTVTTIGGAGNEGIYARVLTVSGGTVTAEGEDQGIEAEEIIITGGTVTVTGGMIASVGDFMTPGTITLGEDMAITAPEGATLGELDMNDVAEGFVLAVLNPDGTLADTVIITAVESPLRITQQPTDMEAKLGENFCVSVEAQGEGLKYQWFWRKAGSENWNVSSQRDNTYDDVMTKARAGREIYCVITDANGDSVTTEIAKLTAIRTELAITQQPNDASAKLDEEFCVTLEAQGDELKYQWYWRKAGSENWNVSGQRDNTYDDVMTSARHNREVYCVITDAWGNTVETEIATITGITTVPLAITRQPQDQTVALGDWFNVTFDAQGDGLKYQWYFRRVGTEKWYKSAQKDNSYDDVMTVARHDRELYCVVTDAWGNKVETEPIVTIMASHQYDLDITAQPENASAKMDEMFCVTVEAQGDGLKYQWYWRNVGSENWNVSGQRDNTYDDVMTKARHNREVKCVITDLWGESVETDVVTITGIPNEVLSIVTQPTGASAAMGENFCVTVEAQGDGLTYTWYIKNAGSNAWTKSSVRDNTYDDVMTRGRAGREVYCVITDIWGNTVTTETVTLICTNGAQVIAMN